MGGIIETTICMGGITETIICMGGITQTIICMSGITLYPGLLVLRPQCGATVADS